MVEGAAAGGIEEIMDKQGQVGKIGNQTKGDEKFFKGSGVEGKKGALNKSNDKKEVVKNGRR